MLLRFVGSILISGLLGAVMMYVLSLFARDLIERSAIMRETAFMMLNFFGQQGAFVTIWIVFSCVFLTLLQWRRFRYLVTLQKSVERIAQGDLDHQVPVSQQNELGELAAYINQFVLHLRQSLDDERKAEQTKNELITNVSHDLRTPLTSILGYLGLIVQDRYRDEVEMRHYVQIAYEKSERLKVLINDLFEYTRMRHDSIQLRQMSFNLVEMLGQLLLQYKVVIEQEGMVCELSQEASVYMVNGDPNKLVRVFENLLANAITYGRDGKRIDMRIWQSGDMAVVEIANYGEPIPSTDLPYIFDRFFRVDKARTDHTGGSGLGLAIAKSIVEKHEGTISVTSDTYATAFQVKIPLIKEKQD